MMLRDRITAARLSRGVTLIELLISVTLSVLIIAGLNGVVRTSLQSKAALEKRLELLREAEFAIDRIARSVAHSRRLLLPLADNPGTNWPEHVREQTVPASPPLGASSLATAVLAVTLPAYVDLDFNGVPDADDDGDGRIDEDLPNDTQHDFASGISLIDDDGDGTVDESSGSGSGSANDDEDGSSNEDRIDGIDNDDDGSIDEDPPSDIHGDGCPGLCGVDDDGGLDIDEGAANDDDEGGHEFDDPYDSLVFYLANGALVERMPVPWNADGVSTPDGPIDGRDFVVSPLASRVTRLRFERVEAAANGSLLVDITLALSATDGQTVSLHRRVRVGGAL
jgi:type II secretory pathway pseudopilin PulG